METIEHTVVLFSQGFCEFSEMVRLHLESRGQRYAERDVGIDRTARGELMKLGATAVEDVPLLAALISPDRWLLWLGILFVLSVYHFPSGVVGRLRAMRPRASKPER